jgi:Cu(I)/Ag(I) efflux system membrane fusion protein
MSRRVVATTLGAIGLVAAFGYGAYRLGVSAGHREMPPASNNAAGSSGQAGQGGRKILYWHDPMVPGQKFDRPGKSPFMDMELVPVYADEASANGAVSVSPDTQQNLGVRIVDVQMGSLAAGLEAVGSVAFNDRDVALVQARSNGYVERLFVRAPLDPVRKGQALLQLYVPDWVAAQEEYLAVRRMPPGANTDGLLDAAKQRMRLAGMTDEQIGQVVSRGVVSARMTVVAPVDGVMTELSAREGMTVASGAPLFRINGLRTVWINAEIPESAAPRVRPGMPVQATSAAFPETAFAGKVEAILPEVNSATRTLKARIELANPGGKLASGMFVTVRMTPTANREVLLVPSEAVIQTGTRTVVIVATEGGKFAPADVIVGSEANGQTEVREGLSAGQKVVASGQFLIDSESSLRGAVRRLGSAEVVSPGQQAPAAATHHATGKVEKVAKDEVTISHGPIPSLKWGPMTMGFALPPSGMPSDIGVGDTVNFEIQAKPDGKYQIVSISRQGGGPGTGNGHGGHAAPMAPGAGK